MRQYCTDALILRNALLQLSKLIHNQTTRIPVDKLAELSATVRPAISGK